MMFYSAFLSLSCNTRAKCLPIPFVIPSSCHMFLGHLISGVHRNHHLRSAFWKSVPYPMASNHAQKRFCTPIHRKIWIAPSQNATLAPLGGSERICHSNTLTHSPRASGVSLETSLMPPPMMIKSFDIPFASTRTVYLGKRVKKSK